MRKATGGEHPRTTGAEYKPNEFYERLIALRETNPAAFARFGSATLAALKVYEKAKRQAGGEKEGGEGFDLVVSSDRKEELLQCLMNSHSALKKSIRSLTPERVNYAHTPPRY